MSHILVLNAGSSSLKFAVFAPSGNGLDRITSGQAEGLGSQPRFCFQYAGSQPEEETSASLDHHSAMTLIFSRLNRAGLNPAQFSGMGHRIVHGGTLQTEATPVNRQKLRALNALRKLAPLHNSFGLDMIHSTLAMAPEVPQIACFDTAFHANQPDRATRCPLPSSFHDEGYRRYGFHGLSYEYIVAQLPALSKKPLPSRLLVLHLGNCSSICAIRDGKSMATTMGYSTLDGLIMGTRSGSMDPGLLIALLRDKKMKLDELEDLLYQRSGLLGLSQISSDMRVLLASPDPRAKMAVDHFCYSAATHAAAQMVAMGGIDAMVFTGGIGANSPQIREKILSQIEWAGLEFDPVRNAGNKALISKNGTAKSIWVMQTDEEYAIARHVVSTLTKAIPCP